MGGENNPACRHILVHKGAQIGKHYSDNNSWNTDAYSSRASIELRLGDMDSNPGYRIANNPVAQDEEVSQYMELSVLKLEQFWAKWDGCSPSLALTLSIYNLGWITLSFLASVT